MSVETLDHMMTYVIEAWMIFGGTYLTLGFTTSLIKRVREDIAATQAVAVEATVETTVEETAADAIAVTETDRLAEVVAVSEK